VVSEPASSLPDPQVSDPSEPDPRAASPLQRAQSIIESLPVPDGTFAVGAGLAVAGVTTYLFQILAFRGLSKPDYGALNALWVFVFVLAPGIFLPVEQEVGRAIAARRARGIGGAPVARRAGILGLAFAIVLGLATVVVATTTSLVDNLFAGNTGLVVCLVFALFTFGFELLARGVFAGAGAFGAYGVSMGAEGVIRLLPCIVLAGAGVTDPLWYGLCLALPPAFATLVAMRGQHGLLQPGPQAPWSELSANLGYLLGGSLLAQVLSYAPFLGAQLLATPGEKSAVADFIVGLFLSRIPILLFQAVQAALLPRLAALVSSGQNDQFRDGMRKLVMVVIGIGVLGVIGGATLGPFVGKLLFGSKFELGSLDVALLAAGSGLFILALTLAQGLIALNGHARAMVAWMVGLVAFVVVTAFSSNDLFLRVELGSIAGAGVSAAAMAVQFRRRLSEGIGDESLASLVEQIEHEPLEI
jgi:O-antigen/teichoic acid export membrane protein